MPAPNSKAENRELIEEVLKQIHSLRKELSTTKTSITEIRVEIAKLNQIENKLKKGEVLASGNDGWFWFSS
jgi:prefoldin subunit 5